MENKKTRTPNKTIQGIKGEGTQGNREGRPPVELNLDLLKEACAIQCTQVEAAALCRISVDTLDNRLKEMGTSWKEFFTEHSSGGKASLRRSMFKSANEGNVTAQIWLSKNHLGMTDKQEVGFSGENPPVFTLKMGIDLKGKKDDGDDE